MSKLFLATYQFFENRRKLLFLFLLSYLTVCGLICINLNLEEDIAQLMPVEENFEEYNKLFNESQFADRIILHLAIPDAINNEKSVELLTDFCDSLVNNLTQNLDSTLYKNLTYKIDESQFLNLYDTILNNLPLFLQKSDYQELNELIDTTEIQNRVTGAYKALISPAGFAFKKSILKDPLGIGQIALKHLAGFQIDDNFEIQNGYILTKDEKHLLFFLNAAHSARETFQNTQLINGLDEVIQQTKSQFQKPIRAEYFGAPAVAVANANRIKIDVTITVTIALIVLFSLITFFYRRKRTFFLILIPTIFGAATALALLVLLKDSVSLISIGIGSVLLGITIDYSLHIFTHFRATNNIRKVIGDVSNPIIMSSLTTAGAFLCLLFVRSAALHDLGMFAAFSVLGSGIFALFVLPHFLRSANAAVQRPASNVQRSTFLDRLGKLELEKIKWLPIAILLISILFFFTGKEALFEEDLNELNYLSEQLRNSEKNLNEISSASMRGIYVMARGTELESALLNIEKAVPLLDSLKNEGLIRNYTPISNAVISSELQKERIENWNQFWTNEKGELVKNTVIETAQDLRFKPDAFQGFYDNLDREYSTVSTATFDPFKDLLLREFISERNGETSLLTLLRVDLENKEAVYKRLANQSSVKMLDRELMTRQFVEILKEDFDLFVIISLIFVFVLLHFAYGRPELALITFLPIVLSWLWTLGLMNLLGLKFNIVNIIIATFIFGLGIDFSIFIMRGLMQEWKYGERNLDSYRTSILLSVLTTLTGIGVLIFAQHPALKSIAALSIIGILSVLLIALTIEPLMFRWLVYKNIFDKNEELKKREYPITLISIFQTIINFLQLTLGSIVLSIFTLILKLLFFIPLKKRKLWVNYGMWLFSKSYVRANFPFNETYLNPHNEDFKKPCIAISNHQSLMDTPMMFRLSPKTIILTKDWVRSFPLFALVTRMADYFSVSEGHETLIPKMKAKFEDGYSIAIFPEGSRSPDDSVKRFHKGAFYLAEKLEADIVPIYIHGTGRFLRKDSLFGKWNPLTIQIGKRIHFDDAEWGETYSKRTKAISKQFKINYATLQKERETVHYWREKLLENYLYKGPILEWYMKVKTRLEDNYELFDQLIPKKGTITNLGCGYGFLDYMLSFRSKDRDILGIDYDEEKIKVAQNCSAKTDKINFFAGDIANINFRESDVFVLADVLHYLQKEEQFTVLENCLNSLRENGLIIVRDGDSDLKTRHSGTKWTEIFSTKIFNFNKTRNSLNFISGKELGSWAAENKLTIERIDITNKTSNIIWIIKKD